MLLNITDFDVIWSCMCHTIPKKKFKIGAIVCKLVVQKILLLSSVFLSSVLHLTEIQIKTGVFFP